MRLDIDYQEKFQTRHIAPNPKDTALMLKSVGVDSLEELIDKTVPTKIRLRKTLKLPEAKSEFIHLDQLKQTTSKNKVFKSYIGRVIMMSSYPV